MQLFAEKFTQTPKHVSLLEKVASYGQVDDFSGFFGKSGTFCSLLPKS